MKRRTISNPKLDALTGLVVVTAISAVMTPVMLEYSPWRWWVCALFSIATILAVVARRRIAAREEKKVYREALPSSRTGRRILAGVYSFVVLLGVAGIAGFSYVASEAFSADRYTLGFQMIGFLMACIGLVASAIRGIRLQTNKDPNQPPQTTATSGRF